MVPDLTAREQGEKRVVQLPLSAFDCARLRGFAQIGLWLGVSTGQAVSRANAVAIPIKSEVNGQLRDLTSKQWEGANAHSASDDEHRR
jgi:hypothetical protein